MSSASLTQVGGQAYQIESHDVESVKKRVMTSFFDEKNQRLATLTKGNTDIHDYFQRASLVHKTTNPAVHDSKEDSENWSTLQQFQGHAQALYACFEKTWSCQCESGHLCGITIQNEAAEKDHRSIMVMLGSGTDQTPLRLRLDIQHVTLSHSDRDLDNDNDNKSVRVTQLTRQVAAMNARETAGKGHGTISKLVDSTLSTISCLPNPIMKINQDEMERPRKKLRKNTMQMPQIARQASEHLPKPTDCEAISPQTTVP